ncbi:Hypothetical protein NTJ_11416 [Nesidiocoris tenuis]|uniref:Uncharacterized protein n=1 Tax=Nesidiocoris tenuis TaxID=355587 RepID=A0ABN7B2F4_9HEMI|nr:Hypothetical protein NTJ_11416 [Nesidiocoris tenuis]
MGQSESSQAGDTSGGGFWGRSLEPLPLLTSAVPGSILRWFPEHRLRRTMTILALVDNSLEKLLTTQTLLFSSSASLFW